MQVSYITRQMIAITALLAVVFRGDSYAASLNDLETGSLNKNMQELEMANVQPLQRFLPPTPKDEILYPKIFGSNETKYTDLSIFPKWTNVLKRFDGQRKQLSQLCKPGGEGACPMAEWMQFLHSIQHKEVTEQLAAVNHFMNKRRYTEDSKNWNASDFWETPVEFLQKNGDCEDYAIAKFMSLRLLGIPNDAMRIVIVRDQYINDIHAVLAVYVKGQVFILDNQLKQMVDSRFIHNYTPIYSVNENSWWRHRA